ncbi:MAG: DUF6263 family protein [Chitinophagaceae bacterium]
MKRYSLLAGMMMVAAISCKIQSDSDRSYDLHDADKVYKLQLNPTSGSAYHYDMENKTAIEINAEGKEVNTVNESEAGFNYSVGKDSAGDYLFTTTYDKIKLKTKNGDTETEADAANAMVSIDPVEKMLGILKAASIRATVTPNGEVKEVKGYDELEEKLMAGFAPNDDYGKHMAHTQWKKLIGEGVVKNTMDQLFQLFPDSAIHLHDTWKLNSTQAGELPMIVKNIYTLKAINDDIAIITSEGIMTSDKLSNSVVGYSNVAGKLEGKQKGEFEVETKTGILISSKVMANIEGVLQVMGKDIPVKIKTSIKMIGRKK